MAHMPLEKNLQNPTRETQNCQLEISIRARGNLSLTSHHPNKTMSDQWFIHINGEQTGPYTGEQLAQYAQQGAITADTMVWAEGMPEWLPATEIEGLLPAAAPAPVATPAPAPAAAWAPPGARRPGTTTAATAGTSPYKAPNSSLAPQAPVGGDYPFMSVKPASFGLWVSTFIAGFVFMILGIIMLISSIVSDMQPYSFDDVISTEEMEMTEGMDMSEMSDMTDMTDMTAPQGGGAGIGGLIYMLGLMILLVSTVFFYINLHRAWNCLQAGAPRTTPGKAVGFLFIPFFNIYWLFVAFAGLSKDWNRVIASHPDLQQAPKFNDTMFLLFCIGAFFPPLALIAIFPIMSQICKGINFFAARRNPNTPATFSALGAR